MQQQLFEWNDNSSITLTGSASKDKLSISSQLEIFFEILHAEKTPRINYYDVTSHEGVPGGAFQSISGGSTGRPKIVERSCKSWILSFDANNNFYNLRQNRVAIFGSITHSLALYGALEGLHLGCEVHHLKGLMPIKQLKYLKSRNIQVLYVTPTQLRLMLSAKHKNHCLESLRYVFIGGSSIEHQTLNKLSEIAPNAELKQFYGSSETSFITLSDRLTPIDSVGKAYPNVEIVLGDWPNQPVSTGEAGRIWVRSPYLFSRYVDEHNFNSDKVSGWVSPGELAKFDVDQNLYILGRIDRMFKIKDQSILPEEIENFLLTKKDIIAVALIKKIMSLEVILLLLTLEQENQ
jgi:long-chain acyl-CoA synthetase